MMARDQGVGLCDKVSENVRSSVADCPPRHFLRPDVHRDNVRTLINLSEAVNAKTPRGKGARNREMARERQVQMTHPAGDGAQQPKTLQCNTPEPRISSKIVGEAI